MKGLFVFICATLVSSAICVEIKDSYLDAFSDSHGKPSGPDFTDNFAAAYPTEYGDYNSVKPSYGPPPAYGPPKPTYGPPMPTYGPPGYHGYPYPVYGPPPMQAPRGEWFLDKFKFKFDLFTLGKILLKLLIFKKIVKFFGILCLLLFLPTLIEKKKDELPDGEDMFRNLKGIDSNKSLNELTAFVMTSIDAFGKSQSSGRDCPPGSLSCRFSRMLDVVDRRYPIRRISKWYHGSDSEVARQADLPSSQSKSDNNSQ